MAEERLSKKFLHIEEAAEVAHCSTRHIAEEIKRGNLRALKPGKRLLFDPADL